MIIPSLPPLELIPLDELVEPNPILLVTTPDAWESVAADLRSLNIALRIEPLEATMPHWMTLAADLLNKLRNTQYPISNIYSVGTSLLTDTAKYLASQTKLPLTCIPTALADASFLTSTSAARHAGCVEYVDTQTPNRVIVDLDLIATAPEPLRAAGICEVLSSYTALWDWEMAEEQDKNPPEMALAPWAADAAEAILQGALDCAPPREKATPTASNNSSIASPCPSNSAISSGTPARKRGVSIILPTRWKIMLTPAILKPNFLPPAFYGSRRNKIKMWKKSNTRWKLVIFR